MSKIYSDFVYSDEVVNNIIGLKGKLILSEKTKRVIQKLVKQVQTPKKRFKRGGGSSGLVGSNYTTSKKTFVSKISTDNEVNKQYRSLLNKITKECTESIIQKVDDQLESMNRFHKGYTNECSDIFFSVALAGDLYITSFVKIYINLKDKIDSENKLHDLIMEVSPFCKSLEFIDPEEEYDQFCKVTKQKDHYRFVSKFVSHMLKYEQDPFESSYMQLLNNIIQTLKENLSERNQRECCDEIIEHIGILVTKDNVKHMAFMSTMNGFLEWEDILVDIQHLKTFEVKETPSLSLRASFTISDVCEYIV